MSKTRSQQTQDIRTPQPARRLRAPTMVALLFIGAALAACATKPDPLADQSFTTDQPCAAPCWQTLELDATTETTALRVLPTVSFIDAGSIKDQAATWQGDATAREVTFGCVHPPSKSCGSAIFAGDRLRSLQLSVAYSLTVDMAVDKLGAPTHVDFTVGNNSGCAVSVAWPMKNIAVMLAGQPDSVCQALRMGQGMPSGLKVSGLNYADASALQAAPASCCGRTAWPGFSN